MIYTRYGHRLQSVTKVIRWFLIEKLQLSWETIFAYKIFEVIIII